MVLRLALRFSATWSAQNTEKSEPLLLADAWGMWIRMFISHGTLPNRPKATMFS